MAKGDREILKADTDDGYTKIADLLLEALAMAKLNGIQKGICLFIWRRTYGWGQKDDYITLKDFSLACNSSETYISKQLKLLINWNVIVRTSYEPGKTPAYTFQTRVAEWDKGCLNVQGLNEYTRQGLYKCARVPLSECARVDTDQTQEPQELEPPLYTGYKHNKDINNDDDNAHAREEQNIYRTLEQEFGRPVSSGEIFKLQYFAEKGMSKTVICEAIKRAKIHGSPNVAYVEGILKNWLASQVVDMSGVERVDREFEKRKGGTARGPAGQAAGNARGHPAGNRSPDKQSQRSQYDSIDFSRFEFKE